MLPEFSKEQRVLPWQPNVGKNKPKLHIHRVQIKRRHSFFS